MTKIKDLQIMANKLRIDSIKSTTAAGSGHPTSCLSIAEVMSSLFFSEMNKDDDFIMSKGHAVPILWSAYAEAGCIHEADLETLRKIDSILEGHPTPRMPLIRVATGSLGQGLPAGVGMALAKRLKGDKSRVYVVMGDGETAEGSVWEAANSAAYFKLGNLCAIVDVNRLGQSDPTMHGHNTLAYKRKFAAFGWNTIVVDGHNIQELLKAYSQARKSEKPFCIIAKTFKGKGVSFLENKEGWHGKVLNIEQMNRALNEIGPAEIDMKSNLCIRKDNFSQIKNYPLNKYNLGDLVSTRAAFGKALVALGKKNKNVVAIDADVKNSTMTGEFFKDFPERSFEAFIAEQNMVGMAVGFSAIGFVPFVATFSTFLTRAHDFIRMANYSKANVKFVGSHAGISIGPDGPSQMGLEDLPMFLSTPNSTVLYPSDAVSTEYLVSEIAKQYGISYLRTTRGKTPVIYKNGEKFPIGGLKVVKKGMSDEVLVISAGVTLHESLKAYEELKNDIPIRVIDLYSLQPFDSRALVRNADACGGKVVVVEDHYCNAIGGIVSTVIDGVTQLCIHDIPRSGKPDELRKKYGIDSSNIAQTVKQVYKDKKR